MKAIEEALKEAEDYIGDKSAGSMKFWAALERARAEVAALKEARDRRAELAESIAEGDTAALERLAQLACDERNALLK